MIELTTNTALIQAQTEAEKTLLGAIMLGTACLGDTNIIKEVSALVSPSDFFDFPVHGNLSRYYSAMTACEKPDIITVTHKLIDTGQFKRGDCETLSELLYLHYDCSSYNYMDYARIVNDYSNKRNGSKKQGGASIAIRKE
jgi:replicative DNA helicase